MIGRLRERQYQRAAERHNLASTKADYYRETARYFELECDKARQFNAWNVDESSKRKHLEICRKAELLVTRRNKLRELLRSEETLYGAECERIKSRSVPSRVAFSPEAFDNRLKEKRAEESLYLPRTCRRIQSYLYGAYGPSAIANRSILREFNEPASRTRMNTDRANARDDEQLEHEQEDYNKRHEEYKENSRSGQASNLYGPEPSGDTRHVASANQYRPAAGLSTDSADHRPHTRRLHDSHFLLGNQTYLQEEGGAHKGPNQKFADRYANRSLEATNVGETAAHSMEEGDDIVDNASEADIVPDNPMEERHQKDNGAWNREDKKEHDQAVNQREKRMAAEEEEENGEAQGSGSSESMNDNASSDSGNQNLQNLQKLEEQTDEVDKSEQRDIDKEFDAKASAGRSDRRHFETEKSMPWLRMIPGDKNLSEQMFLYLTHNELKGQIQDLEKRENQAASKHQWDEALRLRDMRNRLDLAREKNLYRRDDLLLDPEVKKIGMAGIEARSKLLKEREMLCTNSSMYSEEAKVMWSQWLVEDQNSVLEGARLQREDLMKQLEENWRSLAIEDKQRISDSFNKEIIDVALQNDQDNLSAVRSASR